MFHWQFLSSFFPLDALGNVVELSDEQVAAKTDSCERLLWLADRLEPGWSHFRGQMLFEAQAVAQQRIARLQRRRLAPPQQLQVRWSCRLCRNSIALDT